MKGKKRTIICSTVVLFGIWQAASLLIGYSFILPSPLTVLGRMVHLPLEQSFYTAIGATTLRALLGLLLAMGLGGAFASLSWKHQRFADLFAPLLLLMRSVPNISYIVLILYWFSRNISSVIISFLILFPMIYQTLLEALKELSGSYQKLLHIYPKRFWEALKQVYLPLLRPAISASVCNGIAMAFKVGVMAEILGQVSVGIGRQMQLARLNFDLVSVLAWTGWIILLLFVFDQLLKRLLRMICRGI